MNKLTTAVIGLSLMASSLFAAGPKQADSTTTPADKMGTTGTKSMKKHHHKKGTKKATTDTTTTAPAAPAK